MSYLTPNNVLEGVRESFKQSVRLASVADVNLAATHTTLDGVALADGDRVLLKDQSTASESGIYVWSSGTQMFTRSSDGRSLRSALTVSVEEGTLNLDKTFKLVTDNPITVGATNLDFEEFGSVNQQQVFVQGYAEVEGPGEQTLALAKIAFNPSDWGTGKTFRFGGTLAVDTGGRTATLLLQNLTDAEAVTIGSLTGTTTTFTKVESGDLTVGVAAGDLKSTEKIYEIRLRIDSGSLAAQKALLGSAYFRILS